MNCKHEFGHLCTVVVTFDTGLLDNFSCSMAKSSEPVEHEACRVALDKGGIVSIHYLKILSSGFANLDF